MFHHYCEANVFYSSLPCVKGGGTACRDGGIVKIKIYAKTIPQSASLTAFGPGRKHGLLPALAKNMPPAYFLNASRPLHKGALQRTTATVRQTVITVHCRAVACCRRDERFN